MFQSEICEEHLLNSTPHILNHHSGGFILRYGGLDITSNCIYPLYEKGDNLQNKINAIEKVLEKTDFTPVYRVIHSQPHYYGYDPGCNQSYSALERFLFKKNYDKIAESAVLLCELSGRQDELFRYADFYESGIFAEHFAPEDEDFFNEYFYMKNYDQNQQFTFMRSYEDIFFSAQCGLSDIFTMTLVEEENIIGQALLIRRENIAILKDIFIYDSYRGLGYSSKLLNSILTYCLKQGMSQLITEVFFDNEPSINLFASNGMFMNLYDVTYRIKTEKPKVKFIFD